MRSNAGGCPPSADAALQARVGPTIEEAVDKKISNLARQMKLPTDVIYRFVRDRASDCFRTILRENEDIELGPAPKKGKCIRVHFSVTPAEMKQVTKRFDPLNMGKLTYGLAGPLSKLIAEGVERLEADRR